MDAGDITKRFSLHDLFGYLLPGAYFFVALGALTVALAPDPKEERLVRFVQAHVAPLGPIAQSVVFAIASYLVGLVCIGIGDACYAAANRYWFGTESDVRRELSSWHVPPTLWALFETKVRDRAGVRDGTPFTPHVSVTIAYSHLIQAGKDGFVQIMSGRGAMYRGLLGATVLAVVATFVVLTANQNPLRWSPAFLLSAVAVCAAVAVWCLSAARRYHNWFSHHVVYGFLALSVSVENGDSSRTGSAE